MGAADGASAAFSTIFRQTPTDTTAGLVEEEGEDGASHVWDEESSHDGQSEYSGGLSEEPSAAHWAELTAAPAYMAHM